MLFSSLFTWIHPILELAFKVAFKFYRLTLLLLSSHSANHDSSISIVILMIFIYFEITHLVHSDSFLSFLIFPLFGAPILNFALFS